jgi:hypothetical protein
MESSKENPQTKKRGGAPKGNRNAAKLGEDLKLELYLSKMRRGLFEEWFELRFGKVASEDELREAARTIANNAINQIMAEDFERYYPGRISGSSGEVF